MPTHPRARLALLATVLLGCGAAPGIVPALRSPPPSLPAWTRTVTYLTVADATTCYLAAVHDPASDLHVPCGDLALATHLPTRTLATFDREALDLVQDLVDRTARYEGLRATPAASLSELHERTAAAATETARAVRTTGRAGDADRDLLLEDHALRSLLDFSTWSTPFAHEARIAALALAAIRWEQVLRASPADRALAAVPVLHAVFGARSEPPSLEDPAHAAPMLDALLAEAAERSGAPLAPGASREQALGAISTLLRHQLRRAARGTTSAWRDLAARYQPQTPSLQAKAP